MKLKIGEYEIPERCLTSVTLYYESSSVSFAGVLVGDQGLEAGRGLRRLAQMSAIPFEAVDRNGVLSSGICTIKDFKLDGESASRVRFSGRLVRPFQN